MKPFISTAFYGFFIYIVALFLIASPWIFGTTELSSAALLLPIYIGWLRLIAAIFADTKFGMVKQFPLQMSLVLDVIMGFIILVSPYVWGFVHGHNGVGGVFLPQLLMGGVMLIFGFFTKHSPFLTPAQETYQEGQLGSTDSFEGRMNM